MKQGRTVLEAKRFGCHNCFPDTPLVEAVTQMVDRDISCLSSQDTTATCRHHHAQRCVRGYLASDEWQLLPVGAYMTRDVITVTPEDLLTPWQICCWIIAFIGWS